MSRRDIRAPSSWSAEQKARFEAWVEGEEARDSDPRLPRSSHSGPLAFDVARSDGEVDHYELRHGNDALDYLRRRRAEEVEKGTKPEALRAIDAQIAGLERALADVVASEPVVVVVKDGAIEFADRMVEKGVRFETRPIEEIDDIVRVHPIGPDYGPNHGFVRSALDEIEREARATIERHVPIINRGMKRELDGQSGLPKFNRYSIPAKARPGEVECPYCVKRPIGAKGLRDHCRAAHPDKPEAR